MRNFSLLPLYDESVLFYNQTDICARLYGQWKWIKYYVINQRKNLFEINNMFDSYHQCVKILPLTLINDRHD